MLLIGYLPTICEKFLEISIPIRAAGKAPAGIAG
jgi:hypothetical protein